MNVAATVVVVVDHGAEPAHTHADMRSCFSGLAAQDFDEEVAVILVEAAKYVPQIPSDVLAILPTLQVLTLDSTRSYDLKNAGVRAAATDIVLLLDADCTPSPAWLRTGVEHLRTHPETSVVAGRTIYPDTGLVSRTLALLSRAHSDHGSGARARFISNANGAYRRDVFLRFPLEADAGPFSGLLQSEAMWRQGYRAYFEPALQVVHAFEGWPMERDIRNQIGHSTILVRRLDPTMRFAWLLRMGMASIVVFAIGRTADSFWNCLRSARAYGIRWWQLPAAFALAVFVHALELPGMVNAFRRQPAGETAYR